MPYQPEPGLRDFLRRLPKTETHLHIEGALPWELLNTLDSSRYSSPPASWDDNYKFESFTQFEEELLEKAFVWFTSPERYYEAARLVFSRLRKEENVCYIETSFASGMVEYAGLNGKEVAQAIRQAAPPGIPIRVFMGIHHDGYNERSRDFIEDCLSWDSLDGVDLHGTESTPLESWTADFWERARAAGKITKAHAGEFEGPDFVRRVVDELGVRRIQHGIRSVESPELMEYLKERQVVLDVCPISNVKLAVVDKMENHPIRQLFDAGIPCTLNTDDPISFGNTLGEEYIALHQELGFTFRELGELAANGFRHATGDANAFQEQLDQIKSLVAEFEQTAS